MKDYLRDNPPKEGARWSCYRPSPTAAFLPEREEEELLFLKLK